MYSHDYSVNIFIKLESYTVIYVIHVRVVSDIYNSRLRFQFVYPMKNTDANVVNGTDDVVLINKKTYLVLTHSDLVEALSVITLMEMLTKC